MAKDAKLEGSEVYASTATSVYEKPDFNSKVLKVVAKYANMGITYGNTIVSSIDGEWLQVILTNKVYGWINRGTSHPVYYKNGIFLISWDTTPVINESWYKNFIYSYRKDTWSSVGFMEWHQELLKKFGAEKAKNLIVAALKKTAAFSKTDGDKISNTEWRNYAKKYGFYADLFTEGLYPQTVKAVTDVKDVTESVVKKTGETLEKLDKIIDNPASSNFGSTIKFASVAILALVAYKFLGK